MSKSTSLHRKFMGVASLLLISRGLAIVSGIISARYLGPEQFGLYSFVLSIIAMATVPVKAGLPNLLIREIANFRLENQWGFLAGVINWSRIYVIVLSLIIVFFMCLGLYLDFFQTSVVNLLWVAVILIPLRGIRSQQGAILNGFKQPILAQFPSKIFVPTLRLIILFFCISLSVELTAKKLIDISVITSLLAFLVSVLLLKKTLKTNAKKCISEYNIKSWHASLFPFAMMSLIGKCNTILTIVLLGWLVGNESVAYFKVAVQAGALIALGLLSVNAVIRPNIAGYYKQGDLVKTQELLTKSVRLSTLISLPIILGLIFTGEFLIIFLFGGEYTKAYPILVILCIGQLVNVVMGSVGVALNMTGHEKNTIKSLAITLIFNLLLLAALVPAYGGVGAAISVSASTVCRNVLMAIDVWKLTGLKTWICK